MAEPETHPSKLPIQTNGISSEDAGERHAQQGFKPPQPMPGMLNKEMADAAAKKYKKDKKKIQKACAKLEPQEKTGCSCAIM